MGDVYFMLGAIEKRKGDKEAAYNYLNAALQFGTTGPELVLSTLISHRFYDGSAKDKPNATVENALRACIIDTDCLVVGAKFYGDHYFWTPPALLSDDIASGRDQAGLSSACLEELTKYLPSNAYKPCLTLADAAGTSAPDKSHIYLRWPFPLTARK